MSLNSFFVTQLNGFTYFYLIKIILFTINCLYTVESFEVFLCITNNSIKYQSFLYTQSYDKAVLFQTIQVA